MYSSWANPNALSTTSQVRFDVVVGRTAYEVVQVASVLYPWAVRVVRTITLERRKEGAVFRFDSGWVAKSPGLYDYPDPDTANFPLPAEWTEIKTHPGVINGAYNVRRIRETGRMVSRTFTYRPLQPRLTWVCSRSASTRISTSKAWFRAADRAVW